VCLFLIFYLKALYETSNTNRILFLKTKLLGIKMDGNESVSSFFGLIKEVKDKLVNIGKLFPTLI
jgi:hypothetical protein